MMSILTVSMDVPSKIGVMVAISLVSLFAVSFPNLSKQLSFLHIPPIVFFVGKHFGTGVILATAFLHLLDDAFRSLRNPAVEHRYGKLGKWTGLVILSSLLTIFLIEYASTTYVEYLRNRPSAPSTPATSSPTLRGVHIRSSSKQTTPISETTPLLPPQQAAADPSVVKPVRVSIRTSASASSFNANTIPTPSTKLTHSRPPSPSKHDVHPHLHHVPQPKLLQVPVVDFIEVLTNSPRICRLGLAGEHQHHHHQHDNEHNEDDRVGHSHLSRPESGDGGDLNRIDGAISPRVGRKRQIVSILVLQLGIMIHSLVIGLTLAVASGSDFTSLTTAIMFHQLFEGLSLGIRIAALPPPKNANGDFHDASETSDVNQRPLNGGFILWPSTTYLGFRKWWLFRWKHLKDLHWLKPTLSFLFAVTTPSGMALGILLFGPGRKTDTASMLLIQGVMSAISAGMLIYAATVEMIAGDFVFGDVDGGHHHHHEPVSDEGSAPVEHEYDDRPVNGADGVHKRGRSPTSGWITGHGGEARRWDVSENEIHGPRLLEDESGDTHLTPRTVPKQSSLAKRVLAVVSLLLGVVMMIVVGIGE